MTALTLVPDTDYGRVRVIVTDAAGGILTRDGEPVRGGAAVSGSRIVDDYDAPFGVPVTYLLDGATATTTLHVTQAWLSHPTDPLLRLPVTVQSDDGWAWSSPGTVHDVLGASWPVVTYSRRSVHEGRLILITPWQQRHAVKDLLLTGSPLLLRTPPGCTVDDMWLWPRTATREKIGNPDRFSGLRWTLDYQRVARPTDVVAQDPTNAWAAVTVDHPTWQAVTTAHATWLDVLTTPHPHP